jgi:NAD(P)H dehydrogenase (quinone)
MDQPRVSVLYHPQSGPLRVLAQEVGAGAEEEGAVVRVRRVPDLAAPANGEPESIATPDEVRWADAVVIGSPSRYVTLAAPLKSYVESLEKPDGRDLVLSGFVSDDGVLHGGREATLMTLFRTLLTLGGVVVPAPRADDHDPRAVARQTGRDVATVARRLLVGAAAETGPVVSGPVVSGPLVTDARPVLS